MTAIDLAVRKAAWTGVFYCDVRPSMHVPVFPAWLSGGWVQVKKAGESDAANIGQVLRRHGRVHAN